MLLRWRKWDGTPHWEEELVMLGEDEWGVWLGQCPGWASKRPGRYLRASAPNLHLVSRTGDFVYNRKAEGPRYEVYIDLAWDVKWEESGPTGIDMDLDVIRSRDDRGTWIDDEDEWEEHRELYSYPEDVQRHITAKAATLKEGVEKYSPPFDDETAARWFEVLSRVSARRWPASKIDA